MKALSFVIDHVPFVSKVSKLGKVVYQHKGRSRETFGSAINNIHNIWFPLLFGSRGRRRRFPCQLLWWGRLPLLRLLVPNLLEPNLATLIYEFIRKCEYMNSYNLPSVWIHTFIWRYEFITWKTNSMIRTFQQTYEFVSCMTCTNSY